MDDVVLNKIAVIENCLRRISEEYMNHENELEWNYTKQDSIILNLQRACQASIDLGIRLLRIWQLGLPQALRDVFTILEEAQILPKEVCKNMQAMIDFRDIAVRDYQKLNFDILRSILNSHLSDFQSFISCVRSHLIERQNKNPALLKIN